MKSRDLAQEYLDKTDDEILRIARDRAQLTPEANIALNDELTRRRINSKERMPALDQAEIRSLEDVPGVARMAARQEFLLQWYKPVAIAPFMVVLFIVLRLFPKSTSRIPIYFVFASLVWTGAVIGYSFFLMFALRCPVCGWRFGSRDKCSSCGLPRHRSIAGVDEISKIWT